MHSSKAIVIGSGVGGLAAAIRLSLLGYAVTVFEKNSYPGGKLSAFSQEGFHFDAGPSLFTQPQNITELFELAGENPADFFRYRPVELACRYFYPAGSVVNAYTDSRRFSEELSEKLGENADTVHRYLTEAQRTYEDIGSIFLNYSLHRRSTWLHRRVLKALGTVRYGHLFGSLNRFNEKRFQSPETVQLFNRYATYNGSNPYQAPGMLSLIPHLELGQGTWYPEGGMISITNALYALARKKGVIFHFDSPVQRIIHHESRVRGVVVNDQNVEADIVISNSDVYFTYSKLLGNLPRANRLLKQERSSSAVIFYWGIRKSFPQLDLHNIFFSDQYRREFEGIFQKGSFYKDPTVYINITSKLDPGHAPEGMENWFVMVNAPAHRGQNWESDKQWLRERVLEKLSKQLGEDISPLIATESTLDPLLIEERTSSFMGSLYGTSSNSRMAAFLRHANFTGTIRGLYFCGGSVHPGGGIPLCLKSAQIVADLVQEQRPAKKH